jgi:hypothetical protein
MQNRHNMQNMQYICNIELNMSNMSNNMQNIQNMFNRVPPVTVAERLRLAYPALPEWAGVGSIPANSDALNVHSFCHKRLEMKFSPFLICEICKI